MIVHLRKILFLEFLKGVINTTPIYFPWLVSNGGGGGGGGGYVPTRTD